MPKNIVLLSDGTGNSAAKLFRTNVWRTYEALDLSSGDQIAFYHDGVGTSSFEVLAALGGAVGWGLKRNVLDLYAYLCEHYEPDDRLFAFGFSRGAFTIRVLVGLVANQGIIRGAPSGDLPRLAAWAYRAYRRTYNPTGWLVTPLRNVRDFVLRIRDRLTGAKKYSEVKPHRLKDGEFTFVGLWDTVDAYGLPIDELTDGIDQWVWPLSIPSAVPASIIGKGCHALALDDERQTFHPVLWDEREETPERQRADHIDAERITQVWFAGMHANVGGGYADDRLAHVSFRWMWQQAVKCNLKLLPERVSVTSAQADLQGRMYDSRSGFGGYYRYCPRTVMVRTYGPVEPERCTRFKIHESVFARIRNEQGYAPIVLPPQYALVHEDGSICGSGADGLEPTRAPRARRLEEQEECWNLVWWKRIAYFTTIGLTIFLLLRPAGLGPDPEAAPNGGIALSGLVAMVGQMLPSFTAPVVRYFQAYPLELIVGGGLIIGLMALGTRLQSTIADRMRRGWTPSAPTPARADGVWARLKQSFVHDAVRALRTSRAYRRAFSFFSEHMVPSVFGIYALLLVGTLLNRGAFEAASSRGAFCAPSSQSSQGSAAAMVSFRPDSFCQPTGFRVERSAMYRVDLTLPSGNGGWRNGPIRVSSAAGIPVTSRALSLGRRLVFATAIPARRIFRADVFTPIARAGADGADHYVLSTSCTTFIARKSGEVFLFVNETVWPVRLQMTAPWLIVGWRAYYVNNTGESATVRISKVTEPQKEDLTSCRADIGNE